ncbi:MAG: hypothetical protein NT092_13690 [Bacteroidia bacterium]|nr:hypothetical protein [Bacteroidia bacterium]
MPVKKYTQSGIFSLMVLLPILILCILMLFISGIDEPVTIIIFSFIILTFIICLLIFYKLTIIIDDTHLTFSMGIGLVRKSYPLSDIATCKPVKNSPFSGVGIHMTSSGWLYNVSGRYAIEISFKSNGKKIRIGTDKPDEISEVINKQINGSMAGSFYDKGGSGGLYLILSMVAATIILPILLILFGGRETEVTFSDSSMKLRGMYGLTIAFSDILYADTMLSLPAIKSRTNGYVSGKSLKGHFKLQDQSKVLLFIKKGIPPYICIKSSEIPVYLNFNNPVKTREVFSLIKGKI